MHHVDFDFDNFNIQLEEISKIEGAASLDIKVKDGKIEDLKFSIVESKRFYTQAIQGKPAVAVPQLVARICGTCSNAHLLGSIKAVEDAFDIVPSEQTKLLRKLLYYGLIIRDHALHLYIFSSPDIFGKESVLDFDENDPKQHDLLHDMFAVKDVGNKLSIVTGGRAVHAPFVTVGGFTKLPTLEEIKEQKEKLLSIRDKVINLIELFGESDFELKYKVPVTYSALDSDDFSFIDGIIKTSDGREIDEKDIHKHLDAVIVPYSHARGFKFDGHYLLVGALPRVNMFKDKLHRKTQESVAKYLKIFPSENIFHNNLAQAIEILHAIDASIEIIDSLSTIEKEVPAKIEAKEAVGVGYIEAPRGGLYYKLEFDEKAIVKKGDIIVPTGQNQVIIEQGIYELVEDLIQKKTNKEKIINQVEAFIRAFDPCMSCASHFLKVRWL